MSSGRNTKLRDTHREAIARDKPPCHWCGNDIDYDAHYLDPLAFQIDHVTPLSRRGPDTLDNLVPSHRACNTAKSDKLPVGVTYTTERCWWT